MNIDSFFRFIGERRDSILVAATGVYVVGFVSWSLYLGSIGSPPLAILDKQYILSGILPTIYAGFIYLVVSLLIKFNTYLITVSTFFRRIIYVLSFIFFTPIVIPLFDQQYLQIVKSVRDHFGNDIIGRLLFITSFILYFSISIALVTSIMRNKQLSYILPYNAMKTGKIILPNGVDYDKSEKIVRFTYYYVYYYIVKFTLVIQIFVLYISTVFPLVPQFLGGAKPYCAIVSASSDIFGGSIKEKVDVVFSADDEILLYHDNRLLSLKNSYIISIQWCQNTSKMNSLHSNYNNDPIPRRFGH